MHERVIVVTVHICLSVIKQSQKRLTLSRQIGYQFEVNEKLRHTHGSFYSKEKQQQQHRLSYINLML